MSKTSMKWSAGPIAACLLALLVPGRASAQAASAPKPAGSGAEARAEAAAEEEARKAREAREARVPTLKEEDREQFETREKASAGAAPVDAYTAFRRQIEVQAADKRKQLIAQLDQILAQTTADDEKPDLLFQKAEYFLEEGTFHFFRGMEQDDGIAAALAAGDDAKILELQELKDGALEVAKKWGADALKIYEQIKKKYPKYERMPDVLYSMGQAYWDRGDYRNALEVYRDLIKRFPKAQYIPDAWLAFGEYYFQIAADEDRDVKKALDAYEKAAARQESPVFGYATYKQGWCHYNLGRFDKSAEKFKEVVLYSQINEDLLGKKRIGLAKEARKDFVLAYAQYGGAAQAPAEFKTIADSPAEQRVMLERLADIYYGDGKDRDAIIAFQTLMKLQPENTKNPLYQGKIVKLVSRIGDKRQVVAQARKLGDEYKRVRAVAASLKEGDARKERVANDLQAADELSDNTLRFLSTTWHNEAKKTLDNATFEYAYELYGDYLELFPERKEAYEMRFFYAELLYRLEKFEQAGEQYLKVFTQDKKGKWAEAAAEEAVRAYDELGKDFDRANKGKAVGVASGATITEQPIPEVKKKLLAACKSYIETYPKGKVAVEARYKIGRVFYEYNYFNESTPRFLDFVAQYPEHVRAEQAANLVLDTFAILEDYEKLNEAARRFLGNNALTRNPEFRDFVLKIVEESSFKLVGRFEKEKAWEEAGKRYLAFAEEFPKAALADKALANAAATFTRAGQLDRAIKVRIRLVNNYKTSPLIADQMYAIAASYEQIVAYKEAATWLEKFFELFSKDPGQKERSKDALFNASIYRHGTGDTKQAVVDRETYLKTYPGAPDAEDVSYSIATAWEESGNLGKAVEAYNKFADDFRIKSPARALNAQYRAYRLLEKSRASKAELDKALRVLEEQGAAYRASGKPTDDVGDPLALVAFRAADAVLARYKALKIANPDKPAEFIKTRDLKLKAKEAVDAAYVDVVKLRSPEWAVASLYRNGEATADLVNAILAVPPPKEFTPEQAQLFKSKLEEETLPIEEAAANYMVLCLDKSAEFAVFNDWTRKCLGYLEEHRPQVYPKSQLERRTKVSVKTKQPEQGVGMVLEVPRLGERPKVDAGTKPPAPPWGLKFAAPAPAAPASGGTMDFGSEDGGAS